MAKKLGLFVFFIAAIFITAITCGCGPAPTARGPHTGSPVAQERPLFEFHSGFWLNLHLSLHYAATSTWPAPASALKAPGGPEGTAAVELYKKRFGDSGGMGVLFDREIVAIGRRLSELDSVPTLAGLDPDLSAQLQAVAPSARPDWQQQDGANRAWIASLELGLSRHGKALKAALTKVFEAPWPPEPIRVDVSGVAGPYGAYTVLEPVHIIISSTDPGYSGDAALEMIFHEASHALIGPIKKKLADDAARRSLQVPKDLWHALIFYSTGEIVKRLLGPEYVPYATKNGLWARGWSELEVAIRRDWQPYLDGKVDLGGALSALVEDLAKPASPPPEPAPKALRPSKTRRSPAKSALAAPAN